MFGPAGIRTHFPCSWKETYPKESADYATNHFSEDSRWQVYTGNDMFGRGTFGGGGFDIDLALKVIRTAETSVAIFAPGWTYEGPEVKGFLENDQRLWYDPGELCVCVCVCVCVLQVPSDTIQSRVSLCTRHLAHWQATPTSIPTLTVGLASLCL